MTGGRGRRLGAAILLGLGLSTMLYAQLPFREYPGMERDSFGRPADWQEPGEFVVGRLMYPPRSGDRMFGGGNWEHGGTSWTVDYPRGDRTFANLLERLTVIDVRSVEQPVNLNDGDDVFNWPFLLVGMPGSWDLTDAQALKLREYLLRGGFLMADSFFGTYEWEGFMESMRRVFPDRPVVELPDDHALFSVVYDFSERKQIRNWRTLDCCGGYRDDGSEPLWRGVVDDDGRIMVAMSFNNDMGDSWQHADDPSYPQEDSYMGLRLGVNYVVYTMTH
ncbi:MAG TPA: DUF4159 domain-containing protein [Gammaproteobacteria bacterium]|nr:DUF4159 domain-containing protein [Gammaproteobacteria bacterium]